MKNLSVNTSLIHKKEKKKENLKCIGADEIYLCTKFTFIYLSLILMLFSFTLKFTLLLTKCLLGI